VRLFVVTRESWSFDRDKTASQSMFAGSSKAFQEERPHPLAKPALILAIAGIPLVGVVTGPVAIMLGGLALGQIAANPSFRGRAIALAAICLGLADILLWTVMLALVLPRISFTEGAAGRHAVIPSFSAPERSPLNIRSALEINVFLRVKTERRIPFLGVIGSQSFGGSGIVLGHNEGDYLVLTNRHVVDEHFKGAASPPPQAKSKIQVFFHNGVSRAAYIQWVDPTGVDLALLATGRNAESIPIPRDSQPVDAQIGDRVFAVGNPHDLSWSYTEGVISGVREIPHGSKRLRIFQVQVPINQGNSGGGLYLMDGALIGIVSWTKEKAQSEGLSFAIPYETFVELYDRSTNKRPAEGQSP
jgi:S1-C subfamily serine protease